MKIFKYIVISVIALAGALTFAESNRPWAQQGTASSEKPRELENVGIVENLGGNVDLSLTFRNEKGEEVPLSTYFDGKRPVILSLVYYNCPSLCNLHLNGMTESLKKMKMTVGKDFEFVLVSIEPKETPKLAQAKKESYLKVYQRPEAAEGWHFLTGSKENIDKLAQSVGFKYKWDKVTEQWVHSAAAYTLTPKGIISRYLYGIHFQPKAVRLSLVEATQGKIGNIVDRLVLYCFQYDPDRKTYAFYAYNAMKLGGGLTVVLLGLFLLPSWLRMRRESKIKGDHQ